MPILSKQELRGIVGDAYKSATFSKSLNESKSIERLDKTHKYDIFLSHSYLDRETVLQLNYLLEEQFGFDVYVDWIENPDLDRESVNEETAAVIRDAMNRSSTLVYAYSKNSGGSKWMPWELGYSDAKHGRVALLPITDYKENEESYNGQEYLGLYPFVRIGDSVLGSRHLWIHDSENWNRYVIFNSWARGFDLIERS